MRRTLFKSKLDRIAVTETDPTYESSLTIDRDLLDAADILPHEQIHVWSVANGTRLVTYALAGDRGTGLVRVNGGGPFKPGDSLIVATFTDMTTKRAKKYQPLVVQVDELNRVLTRGTPANTPITPPMGTVPVSRRRKKMV